MNSKAKQRADFHRHLQYYIQHIRETVITESCHSYKFHAPFVDICRIVICSGKTHAPT